MTHSQEIKGSASVAIISDDPEFGHMLMDRWHSERFVPSFTLLGSDFCEGSCAAGSDLVIVGCIRDERFPDVLDSLQSCAAILLLADSPSLAQNVRSEHPRVVVLQRGDAWVETTVVLSCEMLRRVQTVARMLQIERVLAQNEQYAMLGHYMLEMRHNVNNALTSVLGNAELLLLEPGALTAQFREQIDTIHNMALRMHEIMQRFTSLETEMRFIDSWTRREPVRVQAAMLMKSSA